MTKLISNEHPLDFCGSVIYSFQSCTSNRLLSVNEQDDIIDISQYIMLIVFFLLFFFSNNFDEILIQHRAQFHKTGIGVVRSYKPHII